ncbi:hypothetical protein ACHQM5_006068 [Ranunculus cassubicifolius]
MAGVVLHLHLLLMASFVISSSCSSSSSMVYIAYMGARPITRDYSPSKHHTNILSMVLENRTHTDSLVRSYSRSFNGFAAKLTEREVSKLERIKGIVSVFPSTSHELHTTRSWDFMGFVETVRRVPEMESNIIVGMIDTGIWPESTSFSDEGFGPPPQKWKGVCDGGPNFNCNNKLIGARFYSPTSTVDSARDLLGHGTHTASTTVGNTVYGANFYNLAAGNARGAVPSARVAIYKVCSNKRCESSDVLAAFDDAISDGVDLISISAGLKEAKDYVKDPFAIGSFHAIQKGILTSQSAGNSGPTQRTLVSQAPWILTVAASSTDRAFINKVVLGDNTELVGRGVYPFDMPKEAPLDDGVSTDTLPIAIASCNRSTRLCGNPLDGKIALYDYPEMGDKALDAKAVGMIVFNKYNDRCYNYPLPISSLSADLFKKVKAYTSNTKNPMAIILKTVAFKDESAPVVPSFSSRGPNGATPEILKPDITAPGVDILAAWSPTSSPSTVQGDERSTMFSILSGTSMACPHVTGVAAYIKTFHSDWSPSAIKSALMTSAVPLDEIKNPDKEFSYGAGHLNPVAAINPGLIYDIAEVDYIRFLCSIGLSNEGMKLMTGSVNDCAAYSGGSPYDLNYPSIISTSFEATIRREVTNVGEAFSTYKAWVSVPPQLTVIVIPEVLTFSSLGEKKSFVVRISTRKARKNEIYSASLTWFDGVHRVRSPIVMHVSGSGVSQVSYVVSVVLFSFLCFFV